MRSLATPADLNVTLSHYRRRGPMTLALCRIDAPTEPEPSVLAELENFLAACFGDLWWLLQEGRCLGLGSNDLRGPTERLRQAVDAHRFAGGLHRTLSIGLSTARPDLGPLDQMLRAEQALRAAQQAGGNRIQVAPRQETTKSERNRLGRKRP